MATQADTAKEREAALARILYLNDDAGASGPIGSQWEKALVKSAAAQATLRTAHRLTQVL
jgi:hypothetical protein